MAEALQPLAAASGGILRFAPAATLVAFLLPIAAGLLGTWLPAFGILPALGGTALSLEPWRALLSTPGLAGSLRLTLTSGLLGTLGALALALAVSAAWHETRSLARLRAALTPILAAPHAALAIGLAFLIAPSGWIVRVLSPWATGWTRPPDLPLVQDPWGFSLALGILVKELPFLVLAIAAALPQVRAGDALATARALGYGPVAAWTKAVLPRVYPQIRLPVYAVLAYGLSTVDTAIVLAPSAPPPFAVLLTQWFHDRDPAQIFPAAAGAMLQLAVVGAALLLWRGGERIAARLGRAAIRSGRRGGSGRMARPLTAAFAGLVALAAFLSLADLALWSLAQGWRFPQAWPGAFSGSAWIEHGARILPLLTTTAVIATVAAVLALGLVLACLENEQRSAARPGAGALWLLYAPLLVPQIGFLFGAQVLLVRLGLDGTWAGLVWMHLVFVLPYVFLTLAEPYRALDERYVRSALCLGAGPARVFWRVKLPLLLPAVLFAFAVGFAVSAAQYLPTLFAGGGRIATLTTEAVTLAAGGERHIIGLYAFAQAALPLAVFAAALAARRGRVKR